MTCNAASRPPISISIGVQRSGPAGFVMIDRELLRLPGEPAQRFLQRFQQLAEEFSSAEPETELADKPTQSYALMIAFYPSFYCSEGEQTDAAQ